MCEHFIPVLEILRLEEHESFGTFGVLRINKNVFCVTLEPPDELNKTGKSSIPAQQYMCIKHKSPEFGKTFKVVNVPNRTDILFHPGNSSKSTEGCILLAQYFGKLKGNRAVLNSGDTFNHFMKIMENVGYFHLTIYEAY